MKGKRTREFWAENRGARIQGKWEGGLMFGDLGICDAERLRHNYICIYSAEIFTAKWLLLLQIFTFISFVKTGFHFQK